MTGMQFVQYSVSRWRELYMWHTLNLQKEPDLARWIPLFALAVAVRAQSAPKFEVASIRLCASGTPAGKTSAASGRDPSNSSPDRLTLNCQSVSRMIRSAYVTNGQFNPLDQTPIEGGPVWIDSDRYQIVAKAEGSPGQETMRGPMLRALLEDRFKVKVHRETREVSVYSLTVAKSGPKLKPFQEGSCLVLDFSKPFALPEKPIPFCGIPQRKRNGLNVTFEVHGGSLDDLSKALGTDLDRIVINRTAIAGKFDFHLEFAPDETTPTLKSWLAAADPSGGPSIFTAIQQQLGLKLESAKGPREFLVIDSIERPSEN
jgi:uncharacterized protein (TIGR03435 family)